MRKLIITAAMLLASAAATAQTPADTDPSEALRRGTAEGAAYCKANLASAPGDLKVSEIETFCSCMGVNEFAMKSMDDATKAMLRPRQQQTCVASIRKETAPVQAATPVVPTVPVAAPPAAPASVYGLWGASSDECRAALGQTEPAAGNWLVIRPDRVRLAGTTCTGPIAAAATPASNGAVAFDATCQGALNGRLPLWLSPGASQITFQVGSNKEATYNLCSRSDPPWLIPESQRNLVVVQSSAAPSSPPATVPVPIPTASRNDRLPFEGTWRLRSNDGCGMAVMFTRHAMVELEGGAALDVSKILKVERKNEMVYNLTIRMEDTLGHGLPTVNRIMRLEIENESAMNGTGSYFKEIKLKSAEYVRCPDVALPKEAAALAAAAASARPATVAAAPPKEPAKPACGGNFEAQYAKTRQRERQIAGEMGQHMQWTPRAFWNLCALERERLALAQRTLSQVKACPSAPSAKTAQRASLDTIQRVNRFINRPGCA